MHIEKKLFDDLVEKLTHVPLAKTADGRNTFLVGIPHEDWQRSENMIIDLTNIIEQSKEVFIGEKEELDNWGLLFVIDSALNKVKGISLETHLRSLRDQCVRSWEKEYVKPEMLVSLTESQSIRETAIQKISINPKSNNNIIPLNSDQPSIQREEILITFETAELIHESHQTNQDELFLNTSSIYINSIHQSINTAFMPFRDQPLGYAEPVDCRKSINHLKKSKEGLLNFATHIDSTHQLPSAISEQHSELVEQIQFLANQIQLLIERIDKGCKTDKEIKGKFIIIETELASFIPLVIHLKEKEPS